MVRVLQNQITKLSSYILWNMTDRWFDYFFLCIKQVVLTACDLAGLWYAVNTLLQIVRLFHGTGIPQVQVSFIK